MEESFNHHGFNFRGSGAMSEIDASSTLYHVELDSDTLEFNDVFSIFLQL